MRFTASACLGHKFFEGNRGPRRQPHPCRLRSSPQLLLQAAFPGLPHPLGDTGNQADFTARSPPHAPSRTPATPSFRLAPPPARVPSDHRPPAPASPPPAPRPPRVRGRSPGLEGASPSPGPAVTSRGLPLTWPPAPPSPARRAAASERSKRGPREVR